jgi:hypothetical protein
MRAASDVAEATAPGGTPPPGGPPGPVGPPEPVLSLPPVQAASSKPAAPSRANLRAEANQFLLDVVILQLRREASATTRAGQRKLD